MYLRALYLHNFRVYEEELFEFSPKLNLICGGNATGKTSLLEAIYFLMTGRSFRTTQTADLIRQGCSFFYLDATFYKHGIEQKLRVYYDGKERKTIHNNTQLPTSASLFGLLQGSVFHPDDAFVVKGSPQVRRHLLDLQIAQANPLYVHHSMRYDKAMRQRNHLLRAKNTTTLDTWEAEMANAGAYIIQQRYNAIKELGKEGQELYKFISSGNEELTLSYKTQGISQETLHAGKGIESLREQLIEQFKRSRRREMELGFTLVGPHKDDFIIGLGNKEARFFASEGQQRSCMAALRLAEWNRLKTTTEETPLMLIDDIGMSLDSPRRSRLYDYMVSMEQVFLTATEAFAVADDSVVIRTDDKGTVATQEALETPALGL